MKPSHFPDSPNKVQFPSTTFQPGERYTGKILYKFLHAALADGHRENASGSKRLPDATTPHIGAFHSHNTAQPKQTYHRFDETATAAHHIRAFNAPQQHTDLQQAVALVSERHKYC